MQVNITLTEIDLKKLVVDEIQRRLGSVGIQYSDVKIETKSKQNYRSEWESGAGFRATINKDV